jgi:Zn-dependent peptidase ImmA (M78 family)
VAAPLHSQIALFWRYKVKKALFYVAKIDVVLYNQQARKGGKMDRFTEEINGLYNKYNLQKSFPVPLFHIADILGYEVFDFMITAQNIHISGAVVYKDNPPKILLNPTEPAARKNFTLAHEIGHIALGHGNGEDRIIDTRNDILNPAKNSREWDANEFAAELLMPEVDFRKKWEETRSMASLAEFFNVSISSTAIRIQRLGIDYAKRY